MGGGRVEGEGERGGRVLVGDRRGYSGYLQLVTVLCNYGCMRQRRGESARPDGQAFVRWLVRDA